MLCPFVAIHCNACFDTGRAAMVLAEQGKFPWSRERRVTQGPDRGYLNGAKSSCDFVFLTKLLGSILTDIKKNVQKYLVQC